VTIDNFELIKKISDKTNSKIIQAKNTKTEEICVVKVINNKDISRFSSTSNIFNTKSHDQNITEYNTKTLNHLIKNEAFIMEKLDNKNLAKFFAYCINGTKTNATGKITKEINYIITEYFPFGSLIDFIDTKSLSELQCKYVFREVLNGLEYMHSQNITHGDIKPQNIFISKDFEIKINNFSTATIFDNGNCINPNLYNKNNGTRKYLAPEILLGNSFDSKKADIFALGVTIFNILTKNYPFFYAFPTKKSMGQENDPFYYLIANNMTQDYWKSVIKSLKGMRA